MNGFGRHGKARLGQMPIEMADLCEIKEFWTICRAFGPRLEHFKILSMSLGRLQHPS